MRCKHEEVVWFEDDKRNGYWCVDCKQYVGETCYFCRGEGVVQEDFGPDLGECPRCHGEGIYWYAESTSAYIGEERRPTKPS